MPIKVRTFAGSLCFYLSFTVYFSAALEEGACVFEVNPTVWRQFTGEILEIHRKLQQKIKECPTAGAHNRAVGRVVVCGVEQDVQNFPAPPFSCYKSNHAYCDAARLSDKDEEVQESRATEKSQQKNEKGIF